MKTNEYRHRSGPIRRLAAAFIIAALAWACGAPANFAQEHPEHPTNKPPPKPTVKLKDVAAYIQGYVKKKSANGLFSVRDESADKDLALKLDHVHRERLSQVGPDLFFVCADFKTADGRKTYDLDFFVQGTSKENLSMVPGKTSVHKEDGKARYTWAFNKETGLWEQRPVGSPPGAESGKKTEHPEHPNRNASRCSAP